MNPDVAVDVATCLGRHISKLKQIVREVLRRDPQFQAVERLVGYLGCEKAALLVVQNALVSYQLNVTGEEYWTRFAEYYTSTDRVFSPSIADFLRESRSLGRNMDQKISRVSRFLSTPLPEKILRGWRDYCCNLSQFIRELSEAMKADESSKTMVFAAKMLGYVCEACGETISGGDIDVPVDYRNAVLLLKTGVISCGDSFEICVQKVMGEWRKEAVKAWRLMCRASGISCLELDTLLWPITGHLIRASFDPRRARVTILENLQVEVPLEVLEILSGKRPCR